MITQTIQTILSLISDVVCFVFSARFINTVLFSFLFFVSIGAAEEKHGKNGKSKISKESKRYVQATNRKKGDKGISFVSTKERSKPSSGKWWILLVLGIGSFVYISKVQSTQSPTPAAEKVNSVIKKGFEFVQHLLADAVSVFQSLVAYGLPSASFLLDSLYQSITQIRQKSQNPFLVDLAFGVFCIVFFILCLFFIYSICRLFLYLSDRSIRHEHTGLASSEHRSMAPSDHRSITPPDRKTPVSRRVSQSNHRSTIAPTDKPGIIQSEGGSLLTSTKRRVSIPFSEKPFLELRKLCHTENAQNQYNIFLDVYMKQHTDAGVLADMYFQNEVQSPIRIDTPVKHHPVNKEESNSELPEPPTEVEPISVEVEKDNLSSDIKMKLSEGIDNELLQNIMDDIERISKNGDLSTAEAVSTLRASTLVSSKGGLYSIG